jgi:hypothetical protein
MNNGYPKQACCYRVLGEVNLELVEFVLHIWVQAVLVVIQDRYPGVSIDGKSLRTSQSASWQLPCRVSGV